MPWENPSAKHNLVAGASFKGVISRILSGTYLPGEGTLHDG